MAAAFFQNKYSTEGSHQVALLPVIDLLNHNSTSQVSMHLFVPFNVSSLSQETSKVNELCLFMNVCTNISDLCALVSSASMSMRSGIDCSGDLRNSCAPPAKLLQS